MDPSAPKITLDQESFKALASDVRVGILKRLDVRRETVTDLSNLLNLSKPTLLEHLEKLQAAGLVKRVDEGRKWIYYELSDKGRKILHPEHVAITLVLGTAVALAAIGMAFLFSSGGFLAAPRSSTDFGNVSAAPQAGAGVASTPYFAFLPFALSAVALVAAIVLRRWGRERRERFFAELSS